MISGGGRAQQGGFVAELEEELDDTDIAKELGWCGPLLPLDCTPESSYFNNGGT